MQIPWLFSDFFPIFIFSLTFNKIHWLFPDFCQVWNFPDFSLTAGYPVSAYNKCKFIDHSMNIIHVNDKQKGPNSDPYGISLSIYLIDDEVPL